MEILNLGSTPEEGSVAPARKSNKKFKATLGIAVIATMVGLGSTLAANITLNNAAPVEFGQGVQQTTSCDNSITVSPQSAYDNTNATFNLSSISLSNIDVTPAGADLSQNTAGSVQATDAASHPGQYIAADGTWTNTCDGKFFIIHGYTDSSDFGPLTINGGTDTASPLFLTWAASGATATNAADFRSGTVHGNAGIAVYLSHTPQATTNTNIVTINGVGYPVISADTAGDGGAATNSLEYSSEVSGGLQSGTATITFLNYPVTSAALSKITVESADLPPSSYTGS